MTHPQTAALKTLLERVEAGIDETDYWWIDPALGALIEPLCMQGQPAFYGSLDAAKELHEAVLPGWGWGKEALSGKIYVMEIEGNGMEFGEAPNPARAWLIAIIKALIADTEGR